MPSLLVNGGARRLRSQEARVEARVEARRPPALSLCIGESRSPRGPRAANNQRRGPLLFTAAAHIDTVCDMDDCLQTQPTYFPTTRKFITIYLESLLCTVRKQAQIIHCLKLLFKSVGFLKLHNIRYK